MLQRAYEYRDAGVIIFEPRMLDAERALDDVRAAGFKNAMDTSAGLIFRGSVESLRLYRKNLESLIDLQNEQGAIAEKVYADRLNLRAEISGNIAKDISLLRGYL
jgi:hypothetical protein